MGLRLFEDGAGARVAGWATNAAEVALLSGRNEFPFPAELVDTWWSTAADVRSYLYSIEAPAGGDDIARPAGCGCARAAGDGARWVGDGGGPVVGDGRGQVVGYGELWFDDEEDEVEVARIIVAPEWRGQGIGTALVRALLGPALAAGYSDVFLRVRPDNVPALRTYHRVGFELVPAHLAKEWNEDQPVDYTWMRYPR